MSLDLDTRQRAMLQEMGVHVWLPKPALAVPAPLATVPSSPTGAAPASQTRVVASSSLSSPQKTHSVAIKTIAGYEHQSGATAKKDLKVQAPPAQHAPEPAPAPAGLALADGIADMGWQALSDTLHQCQACELCTGRRATVFEAANARLDRTWQADWLVVGNPPDEHDEREGRPLFGQHGEAGLLLDNILKAVGVYRRTATPSAAPSLPAHTAYVTQVAKCRPHFARNPTAQELATCAHFLRQEVALVQPKVILAMGLFAAQTLLQGLLPAGRKIPYGQLRGKVYLYQGIPVIVTYSPDKLLRNPQDKARAWADMCLAVQALERSV